MIARHNTAATQQPGGTDPREGVVLLIVMLIVASMTLLSGVALLLSKLQVRGVGYYRHGAAAFATADAGARYVFRCITDAAEAETLSIEGANVTVNFAAPSGFNFDTVTNLTRLPDGRSYMFRVTGHSSAGRSTIETVINPTAIGVPFGIFGGSGIILSSNAELTSGVGSNGDITLESNSRIDGDAAPGPGHNTILNGGILTGDSIPLLAPQVLDPVDPVAMANASVSNNNAALPPSCLSGTKLSVKPGQPLTMPAGTYYFTEIDIGADLDVLGPVVIYCTGDVANKANCVVGRAGAPDNLEIYTTTTGAVDIGSSSEWYGHIYAPHAASAQIGSSSDFDGTLICGGLVSVRSSSTFDYAGAQRWVDTAELCSWKEVRP